MKEYIIRRLKEARTDKGLTQADVAAQLGIKKNTVSNYEKGITNPDMDSFIELCKLYDLDFSEVLSIAYSYAPKRKGFILDSNEKKLVEDYRQLDRIGQEAVNFAIKHQLERIREFEKLLQIYDASKERSAAESSGPHPYRGPDEELVKTIAEKNTIEVLNKLAEDAKAAKL